MDQAQQYLKLLDPTTDKFLFACYDYRKIMKAKQMYGTFDSAKNNLEKFNKDVYCVYVTVNETEGAERKKDSIKRARAIWVEDDNKVDKPREEWPIEPSLIVQSSEGKYHYYWLTSTTKLDEWDEVMATMVDDYGCDNKAKDRARVLRLPGYNHRKDLNKPFLCQIVKSNDKRYKWFEIKSVFKPKTKQQKQEERAKENSKHDPKAATEYSESASIRALLNSENYHGSLTSIAMSLTNKGVSRDLQYMTLYGLMHKIPVDKRRPEWEARVSEQHLYECIDSAIAKKEKEDEEFQLDDLKQKDLTKAGVSMANPPIDFPPGDIGELCKEILEMAPYENREIALAGAIALVAGIVGRCYNVVGMGLNVYIAILADSGIGKANLKDSINLALRNGGGKFNLGHSFVGRSRFTGPKAIFDMLHSGLSRVCIIEESGILSESKAGDGAGTTRALLDLYTSCGYGKWAGDEGYSDNKNNIPALHSPALTIVNVSTPKSFLKGLKDKSADVSGEVARLWMMRSLGEKPYLNRNRRTDYSSKHIHILGKLITTCLQYQKPEDELKPVRLAVSEKIISRSDYWVDMENKYIREQDHLRRTLCSRAWAKIVKLSAICSVYNNKDHIGDEEYEWAERSIQKELQSIKDAFTHEISDDLSVMAKNILVPSIVKCLLGGYKDDKKNSPENLATLGIFTHYNIQQALKNNSTLKDIDDDTSRQNPQTGLDKCLRHMMRSGLIAFVDEEQLKKYKAKSKIGYRITNDFKSLYLDDETIIENKGVEK